MNMNQLIGIHHMTAITSDAKKIYAFYTEILGMRLVKKNVNQDDLQTFHLFFADDRGNAGTDMTFFDFQGIGPHRPGTDDIARSTFRVPSDAAIAYWEKRFKHYDVVHEAVQEQFGRKTLYFEDFDGAAYAIISDEQDSGVASGEPWHKGPVPDEFGITGLGPVVLAVSDLPLMDEILTKVMLMTKKATEGNEHLYEMGAGGNGASVIVRETKNEFPAQQGYGGVHHVAFRVKDRAHLDQWEHFFNSWNLPNSGYVDRHYFESLYIRIYPNILFELATDGPGFIDDEEDYETLGNKLTLPPHLRHRRDYIEAHLKDFDSDRSKVVFEKEYLQE